MPKPRSRVQRSLLLHVVDESILALSGEYSGAYMDRFMADMHEGGKKIIAKAVATAKNQGIAAKTVLVESERAARTTTRGSIVPGSISNFDVRVVSRAPPVAMLQPSFTHRRPRDARLGIHHLRQRSQQW
jgi:hypothetical protein